MTRSLCVVFAGLLLGACYSAAATNVDESVKVQCRALPEVDQTSELEVVQACKSWMQAEPGNGDPHYYYGRTMLEAGATDRAMELFEEGIRKGSRLAEDAHWFAGEGSLFGGITILTGETLAHFQALAEAGDPVGAVLMGYQVGHQQPGKLSHQDREQMLAFFRSASEKGEPIARYLLGSSKVNDADPDNDMAGIRLLRMAAEQGVGMAYNQLEQMGEIDEVPVDYFDTRYRTGAPVDLIMRRP